MKFIKSLVYVSIHPLHRYLGKASRGSPSLFLLQGWLSPGLLPRSLLTLQPLCFPANCDCLNGGKCVSYKYFSNIRRCSCPKKFQGEHCEIGMGVLILTGRGQGGTSDLVVGRHGWDARAGRS